MKNYLKPDVEEIIFQATDIITLNTGSEVVDEDEFIPDD